VQRTLNAAKFPAHVSGVEDEQRYAPPEVVNTPRNSLARGWIYNEGWDKRNSRQSMKAQQVVQQAKS